MSNNAQEVMGQNESRGQLNRKSILNEALWETLPAVSLGLSIMFIALSMGHFLVLEGVVRDLMLLASLMTSFCFIMGYVFLRRGWWSESHHAHGYAIIIVMLLALNSLQHIEVTSDPKQSTNIGLLIVSVGCFFTSLFWMRVVSVIILAGWAYVMMPIATTADWTHYGFMNLIAAILSTLVMKTRMRLIWNKEVALSHERELTEQLREQTFIDPLTGSQNRRAFDIALEKEWSREGRSKQSVGLLLIDVDYFKKYNDTYGHQLGDDCLRTIVEIMDKELKRPFDVLARYGGEEFAVVLPETNSEGAAIVAERIRNAILTNALPHTGNPAEGLVTVSVGVASMVPTASENVSTLINAADAALYKAKGAGRNRVALPGPIACIA